jgi:hypothetical protein
MGLNQYVVPEDQIIIKDLRVHDIIKLSILLVYLIDNALYAYASGLKKKERIISLTFETCLIAIIGALTFV